jgi:hypothetical protein
MVDDGLHIRMISNKVLKGSYQLMLCAIRGDAATKCETRVSFRAI